MLFKATFRRDMFTSPVMLAFLLLKEENSSHGEVVSKIAFTRLANANTWDVLMEINTVPMNANRLFLAMGTYRIQLEETRPPNVICVLPSTEETIQDLQACGIDSMIVDTTPINPGRVLVDTRDLNNHPVVIV